MVEETLTAKLLGVLVLDDRFGLLSGLALPVCTRRPEVRVHRLMVPP